MAEVTIKHHLTRLDMSYRDLAERTGIPKSSIERIVNNKKSPTLDQLERISVVIGIKMNRLFFSKYN